MTQYRIIYDRKRGKHQLQEKLDVLFSSWRPVIRQGYFSRYIEGVYGDVCRDAVDYIKRLEDYEEQARQPDVSVALDDAALRAMVKAERSRDDVYRGGGPMTVI